MTTIQPFVPPPYPYDRLDDLKALGAALPGGLVDLSIGTPCDPPPSGVIEALARSGAERGYPPSIGSVAYREAAAGWMTAAPRRHASIRLTSPPASARRSSWPVSRSGCACGGRISTPCSTPRSAIRPTPWARPSPGAVPCRTGSSPTSTKTTPRRALCLWVNVPGNPTGEVTDLGAAAAWGRERGVPVLSDECYVEFTWDGPPRTILEHGSDGVLAVHSLSKRSNLAGARAGFYAGDPDLVHYLAEVRKHAGFMVPGPVQAAAIAAWGDDQHVQDQRRRYLARLEAMRKALA